MIGDVSRETKDLLNEYQELLVRWNKKINLVAPSTISQLRARHIDDCLQISRYADPECGIWADLGSGGGLPGIVLAIFFASRPVRFMLVESDQRKAAFLRSVARSLDLHNVNVQNDRIEAINPLNAAHISARALAPLPRLMPYLDRHMAKDGQAWLMKGEKWQAEVDEARKYWKFNLTSIASSTQPGAAILKIGEVSDA
ncbi:16S rRNA (guanine(527)-N(7))-methyltransferase RsmG [Paracoccus alkanivorans]|uniref:Ribosomal RNA small subunit methyltransferase G n=1 Tax=Paracoccus alkanivorans TaxID=2116655 RepID=A0A3M0MCR8_9RHOB|nr:16S rRNA (guanine(527)-N(7))-methyltransferase RsmG [Paracoccus alkanivorans]RMC35552.1 16S rRNA (guanine(527)-N(7))-methyltransferase RsmG [Paracoccus alkanivorans]